MADDNFAPEPPPINIDVAPPPDDPRVNLELHVEVATAMTAQSVKDYQNSTEIDRLSPTWVAQQKTNMRNVRYQTIADYQARKARENGQE